MIDSEDLDGMEGMSYLAKVPDGEVITGLTVHNGGLYVVTETNIYKLVDDKRLERVDFTEES